MKIETRNRIEAARVKMPKALKFLPSILLKRKRVIYEIKNRNENRGMNTFKLMTLFHLDPSSDSVFVINGAFTIGNPTDLSLALIPAHGIGNPLFI